MEIEVYDESAIEEHSINQCLVVSPQGKITSVKSCWCLLHTLFETRDLKEEVKDDIRIFSLLHGKGKIEYNAFYNEAYGPVVFYSPNRDLNKLQDIKHLLILPSPT